MAETLKHVKGLSDLQKMLDTLPAKVEANIMRAALRAGANVIKEEAKLLCPVGPPSSRGAKRYKLYQGALRDSIRVGARLKNGKVTATIKAGGRVRGADVWYARLIEFTGSAAHIIRAQKGKALAIGGGLLASVEHPGMKAQPFMRPAMDTKSDAAIQAVGEYVKKRLSTKHGLDTADIDIEVDEQ